MNNELHSELRDFDGRFQPSGSQTSLHHAQQEFLQNKINELSMRLSRVEESLRRKNTLLANVTRETDLLCLRHAELGWSNRSARTNIDKLWWCLKTFLDDDVRRNMETTIVDALDAEYEIAARLRPADNGNKNK